MTPSLRIPIAMPMSGRGFRRAAVNRFQLEPVTMSTDASSIRTTNTIVHFSAPFALPDLGDEMQPAGDYKIAQDEEPIEGLSWLAYRRVATFIHLPSIAEGSRLRRIVRLEPVVLEQLLKKANGTQEPSS
jgi:hypothetical protein